MAAGLASAAVPATGYLIEIHAERLAELFDPLDPCPPRDRDLDSRASEFIVSSAQEAPIDAPLDLLIHLDRTEGLPDEEDVLRDAIRGFFRRSAEASRRELQQMFRNGRISLMIGLVVLTVALAASEFVKTTIGGRAMGGILGESLVIGGWVAMWRPLEVFLYDWWPVRAQARLYDRLAAMSVRIEYAHSSAHPEAWRSDWPAAAAPQQAPVQAA